MAAKKKMQAKKKSAKKTAARKKSAPKQASRPAKAKKSARKPAVKSKARVIANKAGVIYSDVRHSLRGGLIGRLLGS
jgi:pyruvate/2-oxoglutarate dehydrogenase complex dihydrolipoamide acyltransferase (E2) component